MSPLSKKLLLLLAVAAALLLPMPGSLWKWGGLPPGFGEFPPQQHVHAPGFNLLIFIPSTILALVILAPLIFPGLFGFKPPVNPPVPPPRKPLPWWFWTGMLVCAVSVYFMWFGVLDIAMWMFVPAWWGFIVGLDGLAWSLSGGFSPITNKPKEFVSLIIMSVLGWYVFEFLNYYAPENWFYPNAHLFSQGMNVVWYTLSYTTVWPAVAEWYFVLNAIPAVRNRWCNGPKFQMTRQGQWVVLLVGAASLALYGAVPYLFFWALWVGPLVLLSPTLALMGLWTPYRPIAKGNWSPVILAALASVATAVSWESWNYGSQFFHGNVPTNPNYWVYDIPYVNVIHLFSEMPLLGYFGYLPFGLLVWVWWLICVQLFDLDPQMVGGPAAPAPARAGSDSALSTE
jgi:hypothetical protein